MPTELDHVLTISQMAVGKGTVGEAPPPPEGKKGVEVKVALFFDGTMNNRTNTDARIRRHDQILGKKKDFLSSYANFYSNVAILEKMNERRMGADHHVSVYVEGIGTMNFSEEAAANGLHDDKNGNDVQQGFAFGSGETGIVHRVTKGLLEARSKIAKAFNPEEEYIQKITIDAVGFSRGAAAARHFVSRHKDFRGPWKGQPSPPELVVNFIGLFDSVSSFETGGANLGGVLVNGAIKATVGIFHDDVAQLSLAMGDVPKRVVHLTAQDEIRNNFSLTTIDSSLRAGVGFEVALPGAHSDVGGGYVEPDPCNPTMDPALPIRDLNGERRHLTGPAEGRALVEQGWYTDGTNGTPCQFVATDLGHYAWHQTHEARRAQQAQTADTPYVPLPYTGEVCGMRYLTNEYQYLTLYLMLGLAQQNIGTGNHAPMAFNSLNKEKYAGYRVPSDLWGLQNHFAAYLDAHAGHSERLVADCPSWAQTKWLRNKYLHRSSRLLPDGFINWIAYGRAKHDQRVVISDTDNVVPARPVRVPDLTLEPVEPE